MSELPQKPQSNIGAVISRVTFIGEVPKNRFYQVLEKIDAMNGICFFKARKER